MFAGSSWSKILVRIQGARWIDCDVGFWNTNGGACVSCTNKPDDAQYTSNANLFSPNTCAWECVTGFVRTGDVCVPCTTAPCAIGQYRGVCTKTAQGSCQPCTIRPPNSVFTGSGEPFDSNTCAWKCVVGFFRSPGGCSACSTSACPAGQYRLPCSESADGTCVPCTAKPANSDFTGAAIPYNHDQCPWACSPGFFKQGGACAVCSSSSCNVGMYRGPCSPEHDGACQQCTNAPENSVYVGAGTPYDSNSCAWR